MQTPSSLLGGISPAQFLAEYWHKKPLLIRQAIPHFSGLITPDDLAGLACQEETKSRLITYQRDQQKNETWQVQQGPLKAKDFARVDKLKAPNTWTLLVQNVNHFLPEAADLLAQFNFIPHARLDDLMVSYAPAGGGVGPHIDSYDVFLLQGTGQRNWKIAAADFGISKPLSMVKDAPLRLIENFETDQEWILEPGDMLYLPPQIAHWGVAVSDDCTTYSIGFRAPTTQELAHEFLGYLQSHLTLSGRYADADLMPQENAAEISQNMVQNVSKHLHQIAWNEAMVADFCGKFLSEPKPHVWFEPNLQLSLSAFEKKLGKATLSLDLQSILLFHANHFYLNGELLCASEHCQNALKQLAHARTWVAKNETQSTLNALAQSLHEAYLAGYCHI